MSGALPNRAAVFTSRPQDVEIYERGAWWPGRLLGWRHDSAGACQVWVRVEFAGVVEEAWVDLALLRLPEVPPERHLTLTPGADAVLTRRSPVRATAPASGTDAGSDEAADEPRTQHLPLVRDGGSTRASGRPTPPAGGRRRAPEVPGETRATETPRGAEPPAPAIDEAERIAGRHRAPADPGRHRAADTGVLSAVQPPAHVAVASLSPNSWEPPPPRSELPPPGPVVRSHGVRLEIESDGLTRPMRLENAVGAARRSRRDSLSKA